MASLKKKIITNFFMPFNHMKNIFDILKGVFLTTRH